MDSEDISTSQNPGEVWLNSAGRAGVGSQETRAGHAGAPGWVASMAPAALSQALATPPLPPLLPSGVVAWRCTCFYGSFPKCQSHGRNVPSTEPWCVFTSCALGNGGGDFAPLPALSPGGRGLVKENFTMT